jgi:hypothetical protein
MGKRFLATEVETSSRSMLNNLPQFDVPFICGDCHTRYGPRPGKCDYPTASISEFSYREGEKRWRVFNCCESQEATLRKSVTIVSDDYRVIWKADKEEANTNLFH